MHNYVTKDDLITLGIDVSDQDIDSLIAHLNQTINERVGAEITESLDDDELKEMLALQDTATDEELMAWVTSHVPDYAEIIEDNTDIVIGELAKSANSINAAAS